MNHFLKYGKWFFYKKLWVDLSAVKIDGPNQVFSLSKLQDISVVIENGKLIHTIFKVSSG